MVFCDHTWYIRHCPSTLVHLSSQVFPNFLTFLVYWWHSSRFTMMWSMWFLYDFSRREKGETCRLSLSTLNRKWNTGVIFVRHKTDHASSPLFSQQNLGFQFMTWFWHIASILLSSSFFADPKTGHVVSPLCLWICGSCRCNVFLFFYLVVTSLYCKPYEGSSSSLF